MYKQPFVADGENQNTVYDYVPKYIVKLHALESKLNQVVKTFPVYMHLLITKCKLLQYWQNIVWER